MDDKFDERSVESDENSSGNDPAPEQEQDASHLLEKSVSEKDTNEADSNEILANDVLSAQKRRASKSVALFQALATTSHLLTTMEARKRNFLVGTSRPLNESPGNDMNTYFPGQRPLSVMVVTWNTGEASQLYEQNFTPRARETAQPKERMLEDISDIILPTFIEYVSDLIIVCTQEMSPVKKRVDWEILLQEVIGPTHVLFHSIHFGTLSLCIFLRRDLIWFCTEPEENIVKFRAVNPRRTKGSLLVTFNLFGTSFMIINSHFEAGDTAEGRANRHMNFQATLSRTQPSVPLFAKVPQQSSEMIRSNSAGSKLSQMAAMQMHTESSAKNFVDISKSSDCIFWAGDMNFRVKMSHGEVTECLNQEDYDRILCNDEFRLKQKSNGDMYSCFQEADIKFPPTYKFNLQNETDVYVLNRTPAYTDRILYRDRLTSSIECTQYKSVQGVKHSDHKPVLAHFQVKLKPGLHSNNLSYGKFNHEVYRRGCKQRELHHSLGIDLAANARGRAGATGKSAVCVLQ